MKYRHKHLGASLRNREGQILLQEIMKINCMEVFQKVKGKERLAKNQMDIKVISH